MSNSVRPHRWQPMRLRRPWDSPGKNTGVGCHFLLQCMKVKSESEVAQSCPTLSDSMDCSPPDSSDHRIFQARVLLFIKGTIWIPHRDWLNPQYGVLCGYEALTKNHLQDTVYRKKTLYRLLLGEGNGTPLQYSCLQNPMDGGAW